MFWVCWVQINTALRYSSRLDGMQPLHHMGVKQSSEVKRALSTALWWRIKWALMTTHQASLRAHTWMCNYNHCNEYSVARDAGFPYKRVWLTRICSMGNVLILNASGSQSRHFKCCWVTSNCSWNESTMSTNIVLNKQSFPVCCCIHMQVKLGWSEMQGQSLGLWEQDSAGCL